MTHLGWDNGGNPGSVKHDAYGKVVGRRGDATWIADVKVAIEKAELAASVKELARRAALKSAEHGG